MTTDRGRLTTLARIIDLQTPGGFDLPEELLTAARLPTTITELPLPQPDPFSIDQAAWLVREDLAAGRTPDLTGAARRILDVRQSKNVTDVAAQILADAREQATHAALNTTQDLCNTVITKHLQPAFASVLTTAAKLGKALNGQALDDRSLVTAPEQVRTAWSDMRGLADRYSALRSAREAINFAAALTVQHDAQQQFAAFQYPHRMSGYVVGSGQPPRIEEPTDPVMRMLWLTGPAKVASPWLPTIEQQDQAYQDVYSQSAIQRSNAAARARGLVST